MIFVNAMASKAIAFVLKFAVLGNFGSLTIFLEISNDVKKKMVRTRQA
jgi:hypothetical protein